ncbi:MAG: hypothetical protein U9P42_08670, partial [Candidatus Fermentibacteria bacterium]|nr:hypothetical protein [Candidatus Fermentibacteria bacterium]
MTTENILQFDQPARKPVTRRFADWLIEKTDILKNSGLHITFPEEPLYSPLTCENTVPLWGLEGFRKNRYVKSTALQKKGITLLSSIDCNIPVFLCNNKNGVSRVIKSPVFLPLSIIRTAGAVELASNGTTLFLKRMYR